MQFLKSYFGHLFVKCKFNYQQWKPLIFFYTPCSLKIHILVNFWKSEAKIGQIAENAKIKKIQMRHFEWFSNNVMMQREN